MNTVPKPEYDKLFRESKLLEKRARDLQAQIDAHPTHEACPQCQERFNELKAKVVALEQEKADHRDEVQRRVSYFARVMQTKLSDLGLRPVSASESPYLMRRLLDEMNQLAMAIATDEDVLGEAADVANAALLITESRREPQRVPA